MPGGPGLHIECDGGAVALLGAGHVAKLDQFPGLFDRAALLAARDLYAFDNVVTAPLHGYRDTDDYWHRASARHVLDAITVPTLVLNARNDPFLPGVHLPTAASRQVKLEYPAHGGHVGFANGGLPGQLDWLPYSSRSGIRLADTQRITAIAETSDGRYWSTTADAIVTLAACLEG